MFTFSDSTLQQLTSVATQEEVNAFLDAFEIDLCCIHNANDIAVRLLEITEDGQQAALLLNALSDGPIDVNTDNWRIIDAEHIDRILAKELSDDSYVLGCFEAYAIADATDWPIELIKAAPKGEAYSEIGEAMTKEQIEKLAEIYAAADGYGHHFATYDGCEHEIITRDSAGAAADLYYLFRTN